MFFQKIAFPNPMTKGMLKDARELIDTMRTYCAGRSCSNCIMSDGGFCGVNKADDRLRKFTKEFEEEKARRQKEEQEKRDKEMQRMHKTFVLARAVAKHKCDGFNGCGDCPLKVEAQDERGFTCAALHVHNRLEELKRKGLCDA